jgi:hypothetical protein
LVLRHFDFFVLDLHEAGDFRRDGMLWTHVVFFFSSSDVIYFENFLSQSGTSTADCGRTRTEGRADRWKGW